MRYIADHDFHIHSTVSRCCKDENQTPETILQYAKENNFKKICLTNHFWDESVKSEAEWIEEHGYKYLTSVLPLPKAEGIDFLFGAELDMDYNFVLGISRERLNELDFVTVATTHMHLAGNSVRTKIMTPEEGAKIWLEKIRELLKKDLPFHKMGIAHMTCGHIMKEKTSEVIKLLKTEDLYEVFSDCAKKGMGIELNTKTIFNSEEEKDILMRPYYIAKDCGCKFYLGSDAHKVSALTSAKENFERIITILDLQETDKFVLQ
ncbi:MAG: PHP domain-containing protein [Clostridia bacterium]|nr:PHP domain-containing protein [Clostridia bacterium]